MDPNTFDHGIRDLNHSVRSIRNFIQSIKDTQRMQEKAKEHFMLCCDRDRNPKSEECQELSNTIEKVENKIKTSNEVAESCKKHWMKEFEEICKYSVLDNKQKAQCNMVKHEFNKVYPN